MGPSIIYQWLPGITVMHLSRFTGNDIVSGVERRRSLKTIIAAPNGFSVSIRTVRCTGGGGVLIHMGEENQIHRIIKLKGTEP